MELLWCNSIQIFLVKYKSTLLDHHQHWIWLCEGEVADKHNTPSGWKSLWSIAVMIVVVCVCCIGVSACYIQRWLVFVCVDVSCFLLDNYNCCFFLVNAMMHGKLYTFCDLLLFLHSVMTHALFSTILYCWDLTLDQGLRYTIYCFPHGI